MAIMMTFLVMDDDNDEETIVNKLRRQGSYIGINYKTIAYITRTFSSLTRTFVTTPTSTLSSKYL